MLHRICPPSLRFRCDEIWAGYVTDKIIVVRRWRLPVRPRPSGDDGHTRPGRTGPRRPRYVQMWTGTPRGVCRPLRAVSDWCSAGTRWGARRRVRPSPSAQSVAVVTSFFNRLIALSSVSYFIFSISDIRQYIFSVIYIFISTNIVPSGTKWSSGPDTCELVSG